jgi:hypothetical protein
LAKVKLRRWHFYLADQKDAASSKRPKRRHRHVIGPRVRAQDRPVVALPAAHFERPHAVGTHVAEGHGRSDLRSWSMCSCAEDTASAASSESCQAPLSRYGSHWPSGHPPPPVTARSVTSNRPRPASPGRGLFYCTIAKPQPARRRYSSLRQSNDIVKHGRA